MTITATVIDLINSSMRIAGVLASGETTTANEAQDALLALNQIVERFSIKGQMSFATSKIILPIIANKQVYTIGIGGDFNIPRPIAITNASLIINNNETIVSIMQDINDWQLLAIGESGIYITNEYPLNALHLYPVPQQPASLALYLNNTLNTFLSIFDNINLPTGYFEALSLELAKKICIENGRSISLDLIRQSQIANNNLISANTKHYVLKSPFIKRW